MVSVKYLVAALAIALTSCTPPPSTNEGGTNVGADGNSFAAPYEIFDGDRALELTEQCSRISPGPVESTWTPTAADVSAMEPALVARLQRELVAANWSSDATAYIRQYGGLVIGGRRVIYTHGFSTEINDPDEGWRTHAHVICDGGPITFGVEYDLATRRFANFAFNGPIGEF